MDIHIGIHYYFSTLSVSVDWWAPAVVNRPPSARISHPGSNL